MNKTVLHILSGDLWGGREVQVLLQLQALRAQGWDAQALLFNDKETFIRLRESGIPVLLISEQDGLRCLLQQARGIVNSVNPAIVVSHGYKEAFVAWRLTYPWVATFHGASESYRGFAAWRKEFYQFLHVRLARCCAAKLVTVSTALGRQLGFSGLPNLQVIYNVAPLPDPPVQEDQEITQHEAQIPLRRSRIVIVGRLVPVKRVDRAINAFAAFLQMHPEVDAELLVIGEGPLRASLERLAAALSKTSAQPLPIDFLGQRNDAREILGHAALLVISSESEGIPTVLLEAASYGVPVVSTDVGGISEVFKLLPGYPARLVSPFANNREFAEAIADVLSQRKKTGNAFRALFETHFTPTVAAEKLNRMYLELLTAQQ